MLSLVAHAAVGFALHALPSFDPAPETPLPIRVFLERVAETPAPEAAPAVPAPAPRPAAKPAPRPARRPPPAPTLARVIESTATSPEPAPSQAAPPETAPSAPASEDVAAAPPGAAAGGAVQVASLGPAGASPGEGRSAAGDPEAAIRAYIDEVRRRIEAAKRYPALARSRKVEGTVVALLHLGQNGGVESVEIVESPSGLLAEPTRLAILSAGPFEAPPGALRRIRVPVRYRLD